MSCPYNFTDRCQGCNRYLKKKKNHNNNEEKKSARITESSAWGNYPTPVSSELMTKDLLDKTWKQNYLINFFFNKIADRAVMRTPVLQYKVHLWTGLTPGQYGGHPPLQCWIWPPIIFHHPLFSTKKLTKNYFRLHFSRNVFHDRPSPPPAPMGGSRGARGC